MATETSQETNDAIDDDEFADSSSKETEKKAEFMKGYCLYKHITNRLPTSPVEKDTPKTVSKFLKEKATSNKDFSLSLVKSDLKEEQEAKLRDFIIKRLSRSTVYSSCGNLATLSSSDIADKPVTCYYKLIKGTKLNSEPKSILTNKENDGYCSLDFLVCFVVSETSNLHLFQQELETYCQGFESSLKSMDYRITTDTSEVFKDIENWYDINIMYVCRCTKLFLLQLASLINVGLLGSSLDVVGCEDKLKEDINRLVDVCSLSSLLSTPVIKESNHKLLEDIVKQTRENNKLTFSHSGFKFEVSDLCEVCNDWAKTMVDGEQNNPVFLRQVMENYKLKVIQDMNSLKRLLMEAETSHYALFKAYTFLSRCHSSKIVVEHIRQEAKMSMSKDMCAIIKVLEEFICEKGGFSKIRPG